MAERRDLARVAARAWRAYDACVRLGGDDEARRVAFDRALQADEELAAHDWARQTVERREKAARALSGA